MMSFFKKPPPCFTWYIKKAGGLQYRVSFFGEGEKDNNVEETRTIDATAMDGGNGKRRIYHGRMVSQLRPKEDKVVTRRHNADDERFGRDRFSFRCQEGYYEYHPHHVYFPGGYFANETTAARVTGYVTGL
jgi:hypothetical protein